MPPGVREIRVLARRVIGLGPFPSGGAGSGRRRASMSSYGRFVLKGGQRAETRPAQDGADGGAGHLQGARDRIPCSD